MAPLAGGKDGGQKKVCRGVDGCLFSVPAMLVGKRLLQKDVGAKTIFLTFKIKLLARLVKLLVFLLKLQKKKSQSPDSDQTKTLFRSNKPN